MNDDTTATWQDDDDQYVEEAQNIPTAYVDGMLLNYDVLSSVEVDPYDFNQVEVSFEDTANGCQDADQERAPLGWCNSASIELKRGEDAVTVSISAGDPRGAFALTIRRMRDGTLIMHVPTHTGSHLHMPMKLLHDGTYQIG